ncbi:unnamed protein product [Symbiodinium pilosum]|uniref:Lysine-specific metallo-endopeptidase domain-containing protein n=1 Tax=Symbiodinium pilosum TaxID=2952 RepID=A0A812IMN9_SYMPI|nr:unnamed protein product [Symbiodinium pilosum]
MACLDASCGDEVNISIDELFNNPPIPPPPHDDNVAETQVGIEEDLEQGSEDSTNSLIRVVLQLVFGRYPAPLSLKSQVAVEKGSLIETFLESRPDPQFHPGGYVTTESVEKEFTKSALLATRWVVEACEFLQLERNSKDVNELFRGWFKSDADQVKDAVGRHLFNIYSALLYLGVVKAPVDDQQCKAQGNMAYVTNKCPMGNLPYLQDEPCGQRAPVNGERLYVVHVCPVAWKESSMFHVGNIIHEASHHYGTKDLAYGIRGCLELSTLQALSNADQYVYFVQHLVALKYPDKLMRSYRGAGKGDHVADKVFVRRAG